MRISAIPAKFKADFGLFRLPVETARFWPNQPGLVRIEAESARIEPSRHESQKKKSSNAAPTCGQPRRTRVRHPPSRVRAFQTKTNDEESGTDDGWSC